MCTRTARGGIGLTFLEPGFGDGDHLDTRHTVGIERLIKYREIPADELLAVQLQLVCRVGYGTRNIAHPTASSISMETTLSKAPFQLSGRL
jgi:hypothetical protein